MSDGLARITLNRPTRLNAVDPEAIGRWQSIPHEIADRDEIGAVLFDANGPRSAGAATCSPCRNWFAGESDAGALITWLADRIHHGHRVRRESSKPIVAAVQGPVAGGGPGFMLVADVIVASERATFAIRCADVASRSFQEALDDEARTIGAAFETPEAQAGVAAFAAAAAQSAAKRAQAAGARED